MSPPPPPRRWRWRWPRTLLVVGALLVGGLLLVLTVVPRPMPVDTARAQVATVRATVEEDGLTRVKERYVVSAPLHGNVGRIEWRPGDPVDAGQLLAWLTPTAAPLLDPRARAEGQARLAAAEAAQRQAQTAVARAENDRALAARELERQRALTRAGALSAQDLERAVHALRAGEEALAAARFGARIARHEREVAEAALGTLSRGAGPGDGEGVGGAGAGGFELRSPVAGQVLRVHREDEGVVQAGTPLLEVGDLAKLEVVVDLLTQDAVQVGPGTAVTLTRWGGRTPLGAHVQRVEPGAFTRRSALGVDEQRVNVVVEFDEPLRSEAGLGDGFRVEARLLLATAPEVLAVPTGALFRRGEEDAVYVVRDGRAREQVVRLGLVGDSLAEVREGLTAGERVVLFPGESIAEGVPVRPRAD